MVFYSHKFSCTTEIAINEMLHKVYLVIDQKFISKMFPSSYSKKRAEASDDESEDEEPEKRTTKHKKSSKKSSKSKKKQNEKEPIYQHAQPL